MQRVPELLSYIQTAVDTSGKLAQYVLSGSQQFSLLAGITQSLAGRACLIELHPLRLRELQGGSAGKLTLNNLLLQGGYPAVHARKLDPSRYYADYVGSYIERDVRSLSAVQDLGNFQRFMRLCAWLLGITSAQQMASHYARGALFETWVVTEALKWRAVRGDKQPLYFWRDNIGNEIDLLLEQNDTITLVEIKSGQTFQDEWLRSLQVVHRHLGEPTRRALIYGGDSLQMRGDISVVSWQALGLAG